MAPNVIFLNMKKGLLILSTIACLSCKRDNLELQVYKVDNGYGYEIIHKDRILIKQNSIPSVQGNKKFCDSIDAVKVGNRVIDLLRSNKIPVIKDKDLKKLNIKLKC